MTRQTYGKEVAQTVGRAVFIAATLFYMWLTANSHDSTLHSQDSVPFWYQARFTENFKAVRDVRYHNIESCVLLKYYEVVCTK